MNGLYYLAAYSPTRGAWHRYLVTAIDSSDAQNQVAKVLEARWAIRICMHICMTANNLFRELEH